jgi:murein DD-endopeptidase MepM/ murein hydrolase activator NlpD
MSSLLWYWPTTITKISGWTHGQTVTRSDGTTYIHWGVDIGTPVGTPVVSPITGEVIKAGWEDTGYGNLIIVKRGDYRIYLAHLSGINVKVGDQVKAGDPIGYTGNTGNSSGPHLHYEIRLGSGYVDPFKVHGDKPSPTIPVELPPYIPIDLPPEPGKKLPSPTPSPGPTTPGNTGDWKQFVAFYLRFLLNFLNVKEAEKMTAEQLKKTITRLAVIVMGVILITVGITGMQREQAFGKIAKSLVPVEDV